MKRLLTWLLAVGTLLPAAAQQITEQDKERAAALVERMTLDEKLDYIGGFNSFYIRAIPRLGIPQIRMADGPQGVRNDTRSTMFPCGIAAAAAWDRALVRDYGRALGQDCRARGVHILLGPGVNIYRSPLCGRNFEYYGEDPYLAAETAAAYIEGMQAEGVMACVKHFVGNNQEWNRHHVSSDIDERTLHEIYLPAFRKAVTGAKVGAVMSSYNPLNCVHMTENRPLTVGLLREKWGFDGIFMSDWNATYSAVGAANGGLDLEMPRARFMNAENLRPALENGLVTEATVDEKCRHILQTLIAFGFLDREQTDAKIKERNPFFRSGGAGSGARRHRAVEERRRDAAVLVQSERRGGHGAQCRPRTHGRRCGIRPSLLDRVGGRGDAGRRQTFAHDGARSRSRRRSGRVGTLFSPLTAGLAFGASSSPERNLRGCPWRRRSTLRSTSTGKVRPPTVFPPTAFRPVGRGSFKPAATGRVTFVVRGDDGYRLYVDGREVLADWRNHAATTRSATLDVVAGKSYAVRLEYYDNASTASVSLRYLFENVTDRERRIAAADAVIYCAGFDSDTERENHDRTFALPEGQAAEIAAVAKLNANLVVVVNSGGGVDFAQFADRARAILMAWYPGQEGGRAVAEILTGAVSPSGKLPISIERRAEDNPCYGSYYENVDRSHRKGAPQPRVNYDEGIFVGYRGYDRTATEPLYAFGYGLSYTTFAYSGLKVVRQDDGSCRVSFDVRNTGRRDGAEVAQLYVSDLAASVPRPVRELKGYEKVFLKRGRDEARGDTPAARRLRLLRYGAPRLRGRAGRFPDSGGRFVARPAAERDDPRRLICGARRNTTGGGCCGVRLPSSRPMPGFGGAC